MAQVREGDVVMYARAWLRSTGQLTGDVPFRRGRVVRVEGWLGKPAALATVQWDGARYESRALVCNLVRADRLHLERQ